MGVEDCDVTVGVGGEEVEGRGETRESGTDYENVGVGGGGGGG